MDELINKIKSIQNKQRSLMWGSAEHGDNEVLMAVGSKAYPNQPHYFIVNDANEVFLINSAHHKTIFKQCTDKHEVISVIIELLKNWFPAKS